MPDTPAAPKQSFLKSHRGAVIGGSIGVLGLGGYLLYRHFHPATTAPSSAVATSAASATQTSTNPYVNPPGTETGSGTSAGGWGGFSGSSAGAFANEIAADTASAFAKVYPPGSGAVNPARTSTGTSPAASSTPNSTTTAALPAGTVAAKNTQGATVGTAVGAPSKITLKGVTFAPTRQINIGGVTWYGVPNQPTAQSLKNHKVTVTNVLGGAGLYAHA